VNRWQAGNGIVTKSGFWFMFFMIFETRYDGTMDGILMMLDMSLSSFNRQ